MAKNRRGKKKAAKAAQVNKSQTPVVVVQTPPPAQRRAAGSSAGRRRNRSRKTQGTRILSFTLNIVSSDVAGDAKGTLAFGPTSILSKAMVGMIQSFQHYRITSLVAQFVSAAASTDRGLIAFHVDTSLSQTGDSVTNMDSFTLRQGGTRSFGASSLGDVPWYENNKDQFNFVIKCSGAADITVGHWRFTVSLQLQNPL